MKKFTKVAALVLAFSLAGFAIAGCKAEKENKDSDTSETEITEETETTEVSEESESTVEAQQESDSVEQKYISFLWNSSMSIMPTMQIACTVSLRIVIAITRQFGLY